ncbi:MAG TPA: cupin domain-containing protein [Acidobacteriaceae bacterium]
MIKSLALCVLLTAVPLATAQAVAVAYAPPSHSNVLNSTIVNWDSLIAKPSAAGSSRAVFDNPTPTLPKLESHITTLNPGMESHPPHHHPWEEMILIKEGHLEVQINGIKHAAGPGSLLFFASHDPHNLKNVGTTPATYYVMVFATDRTLTTPDKSAAEQAVPGKLSSSVFDCDSLATTPTPTGARVVVVNSPTLTFNMLESHITTLNAGQSTAVDMLDPGDEIVVFKSGQVEITVNGVSSRVNAGSMLYWAPNDKRTIRNLDTTPATYQVIRIISDKSPK